MKKQDFITLVIGVLAGLCFSIGLCMCLLPEWNAFPPGVVLTALGTIALLVLALVCRKGKPRRPIAWRTVGIVAYATAAFLILGVGMAMILVWDLLLWGLPVGVVGIVLLLGLIPMVKGFQT